MLDQLVKAPFLGFEKESLKFLKDLSNPRNNNRTWFGQNKETYENYIRQPMKDLIDTLGIEINKIDPDIVVNYKSIFRINRDIRFSKDKTPYKNLYSAAFAFGRIKSAEIPHFYFQFKSDEFLFAGGQYSMDPNNLKKIRAAIFNNFDDYKKIIQNRNFKRAYGAIAGESLTKLPKGFIINEHDVNPLLLKSLRMKQFYVYKTYPSDIILGEKVIDVILKNIKLVYSFTKFLSKAIK